MLPVKAVVEQARKYLGVEFGHQGRARIGDHAPRLDCIGILFCVGEDLGLADRLGVPIRRTDSLDYGPQPHDERIQEECKRRLIVVQEFAAPGPPIVGRPQPKSTAHVSAGDVLTLRVPHVVCHVAIVTAGEPNPIMLYAMPMNLRREDRRGRGRVVETLMGQWREQIAGIFRFPGVDY